MIISCRRDFRCSWDFKETRPERPEGNLALTAGGPARQQDGRRWNLMSATLKTRQETVVSPESDDIAATVTIVCPLRHDSEAAAAVFIAQLERVSPPH
ncbi:hypothetical protein EVAR_26862_1 [Eumeta japonica]|uniref:Uncharacterized protein n=1 Tax=Eumeta variegata TaxID=151549 RepID=A0A4C1VVC8_EUMVA|nr:hypothetical protein EVAR_26862_1 [Eumeta japonica]